MEYVEYIKKNNPIIFNIFKNSFENNKFSHAYLFSASREILIEKEPLFLIQLLISKNPFKGEIRNINSYVDLEIIDNEDQIIKKEQIIEAIKRLQETPFERAGKKILLINKLERANAQSLNSLLMFLEDPTPNTYLIFTTNNLAKILNTIKSRTQIINIKTSSKKEVIEKFLSAGLDREDAKLLSDFTSSTKIAKKWKDNNLSELKKGILNIFEQSLTKKALLYTELFSILKSSNAILVLNFINSFFNDIWKQTYGLETSFNRENLINKYIDIKFDYKKALKITSDFIKNLNINVNFDLYKNKFLLEIMRIYD